MDALSVEQISKSFGGVQAVSAVSLRVPVGERRALIGPNGAGKTTLFSVIAGEYRADQGVIKLFDTDITHASVQQRAKRGLGRTYQISQLFNQLTVEENLFLAAAATRNLEYNLFGRWQKHAEARTWVREVAAQVQLESHLHTRVDELSHGLQRQLEVGMAIAPRPRLIMLDEPAAGLSPSERAVLTRLISGLARELTLVIIEHDMGIVLEIADRITVLHRGAVIAEGSPGEIRANTEVQQVYLGNTYS